MELSDYVKSGTWDLIEAPAEIRIIQSNDPPYQNRTEMVFFMGNDVDLFVQWRFRCLDRWFSHSKKIFILYDQFNRSNDDDFTSQYHIVLFTEWCSRKDDIVYFDSRRSGLFYVTHLEDFTLDLVEYSIDLEIFDAYIYYESGQCFPFGIIALSQSSSNDYINACSTLDEDHLSSCITHLFISR